MRAVVLLLGAAVAPLAAGNPDLFGYFEPQYSGTYQAGHFGQLQSDRLRVDLEHRGVRGVELGADVVAQLFFGRTDWNLLDVVPDRIAESVPPERAMLYRLRFEDRYFLDNAYARFSTPRLALTAGRQQLSFGTGYFANPTDLFNTKDALDPTYEQPGHNGVRLDAMPARRVNVTVLYAPVAADWANSGKLVRVKAGAGHFDFSLTGAETRETRTDFETFLVTGLRRRTVGADVVGQLLDFGVWAEGGYSFLDADDDFYELVAGADYTFESGLYAMLEYHRNARARADWRDYDLNDWLRFFAGENRTVARDQVYGYARYPLSDLAAIGAIAVAAFDGSGVLVPTFEYSLFENVDLTLMLNLFLGAEGRAYGHPLGSGGLIRCRVYF